VAKTRPSSSVGYAWAALGKHTRRLQKTWAAAHPGVPLVFVQSNTPTAGLSEGVADVTVVRRALTDARFETALIGVEARFAAVATDNPLARRRSVRLADLARYAVAIDSRTGTTTGGPVAAGLGAGRPSVRDMASTNGSRSSRPGRPSGSRPRRQPTRTRGLGWPTGPSVTPSRSRCGWPGGRTSPRLT
jgi:hypothetical protein